MGEKCAAKPPGVCGVDGRRSPMKAEGSGGFLCVQPSIGPHDIELQLLAY